MLYNRHKLDKAGEALIGTDPFKRNNALIIIQEWRDTHLFVLQQLNSQIASLFAKEGIAYSFSSMRIKRMTSIEAKLRNNAAKSMKLGGMQDIGGIRYVFPDIAQLDEVKKILDSFVPKEFVVKKSHDYVSLPKDSGYRSIHYVYQYKSGNIKYDGISIELQVRTRLQHAWAMAVETASLISKTTLKADIDNETEWRNFFRLVSALFAREEHKPVLHKYEGCSVKMLCDEFFSYKEQKLIDQLKALRVTVNIDLEKDMKGFCVLTIDFVRQIVNARIYREEDSEEASRTFSSIESTINADEAALMVAIEKIQEIKEAYPSYFLDTKSFLEYLEHFEKECSLTTNNKTTN